jgi:TonB family protein
MKQIVSAQQANAGELPGTFWAGTNSDKDAFIIEFLKDGKLIYTSATGSVSKGRWIKDSTSISIELNNKFSTLKGKLSGNQIEGDAVNKKKYQWRWSATQQQATVVSQVAPTYPPLAGAARVSGKVRVEVQINSAGNVLSVKMLEAHALLRDSSEKAAKKWRFNSVTDQNSIRTVLLTFSFRLPGEHEIRKEKYEPKFISAYQIEITKEFFLLQKEKSIAANRASF